MSLFPHNWSTVSVKILSRPIGSPIGDCEDGDGDGMCTPKGGTEDNVPVILATPVEARGKHSKNKAPTPATPTPKPAQSSAPKGALYTPGVPEGMERLDARLIFSDEDSIEALGPVAALMSEIHGVNPFDGHQYTRVTIGTPNNPEALGQYGADGYQPAGWWTGSRLLTGEIIVNSALRQKGDRAFTFAHEMGHRIDVVPHPDHPGMVVWWSNTNTPAMVALMDALAGLPRHQERIAYFSDFRSSGLTKSDREYLLSPQEIWARLYSQWIAEELKKRGNQGLEQVVNTYRDINKPESLGGFMQFSEEEMQVLRPLIIGALIERGLVRP